MRPSRFALVLVAVCVVVYFVGLDWRPLWDIDEGMHAQTSKEMVESGDWVTPTFNGEPFFDKPAFHNWMVALAFLAFGYEEFAARLPAALMGLGTVLVTFWIGRRALGERAGFLGALVLATSALHAVLSRSVVHDITLSFFVCLTLAFFYVAYADERQRTRNLLLCYLACGFAVLAKGPVGAGIPGLTILAFLAARKHLAFVLRMKVPLGALIVVGVSAPWYLAVAKGDPSYAYHFFMEKNVLYFLNGEKGHVMPFYFYFHTLLVEFLPWTFLLPAALWGAFRARASEVRAGLVFAQAWFWTGFVFFNLSSAKLGTYLLPLMPALALLTGWLCDRLLAEGAVSPLRRTFLLAQAALVAIAVAGAVYVFFLAPPDVAAGIGLTLGHLQGVAVLGLAVTGAGLIALWTKRDRLGLAAIAAFLPAVLFYFLLFLAPAINPYRTMKGLSGAMDSFMSPGQDIVFYKRTKDTALFYSDRTVRELEQPEDVAAYLAADERVFLFVDRKKVDELERLGLGAHVVGREGEVDVYSNRPGALDLP